MMGQHSCHCKKAENIDDCKKKKRFRLLRWTSCWTAGEKYSSAQGDGYPLVREAAAGQLGRIPDDYGSMRQAICTVENHNLQEPSAGDPGVLSAAEKHDIVHSNVSSPGLSGHIAETSFDWSTDICQTPVRYTASDYSRYVTQSPDKTLSQWSIDSGLTPACTVSDWSIGMMRTPAHTMSDWNIGMKKTSVHTKSDWKIGMKQTSAYTSSDWSTNITQTPVHMALDWSIGVIQAPVQTGSAWSIDVTQSQVHTASDWSIDISQASAHKASDWSVDVIQAPVRTASDWNIDVTQGQVNTESDWSIDVYQAPVHTASVWSIDVIQVPARTASDWSTKGIQTSVHIASKWFNDIGQTSVCRTLSDWCTDANQIPVLTSSEWNINVTRTSTSNASDWFVKDGQSRVCTKVSSSRQIDSNVKMKAQVINSCHYVIGDMLGEGNFGAVYEGSRLQDGLKVAVKYVRKTEDVLYISIPGHSKPLPLEVALLILANRGPSVPEIIKLLDWQDQHDHYIMVLEHPSPCEDLFNFSERHGGSIDESLARVVMQQATQAAYMCCHRGVLHRDIKLENLLINKETHKVKLIDFGCGDLLKKSPYKIFTGTDQYCPPEFEDKGEYNGKQATVWSLGILLFALVCGDYPNTHDLHEINANNYFKAGLSNECCRLLSSCLQRKPERRLHLSKILLHEWFKVTDVENFTTM